MKSSHFQKEKLIILHFIVLNCRTHTLNFEKVTVPRVPVHMKHSYGGTRHA